MTWAWAINTGVSGAAGAVLAIGIGFFWGGWTSAEGAARLATKAAESAVATSWTPYCVAHSKGESAQKVMAELKVAFRRNRPGVIENAGWATPIGETQPNQPLARACALAIAAQWPDD